MLFTINQLINGLDANITKKFDGPEVPKSNETPSSTPNVPSRPPEQHPTVEAREDVKQLENEITPPKPSESPAPQAEVTTKTPEQKQAEKTNRRKAFVEDLKKKGGKFPIKALLIGEAFKWLGEVEANEGKENLGFFDKLGNWVKKLFGGAILKWLGYDLDKEEKEVNGSVGSKTQKPGETKIENNNETISLATYSAGLEILFMTKGKKGEEYILSILKMPEIRNKSFNDIINLSNSGENGIAKRVFGDNTKQKDKEVYESLKFLSENNETIDGIIGKTDKEWKSSKIGDVVSKFSKEGGSTILQIAKGFEGVNVSLSPLELFKEIDNLNFLEITHNNETGEISLGSLQDRKLPISSKGNLLKIISFGSGSKLKGDDKEKERFHTQIPEEKEFIDTLFNFREKIIGTLSSLFGPENEGAYKKFFNEQGLTMSDIIALYMITNGETDLNKLNNLEQSLLYFKLFNLIGEDRAFRGEHFDKILLEGGVEKLHIPEGVKKVLGSIFVKVTSKFIDTIGGAFAELYNALPTSYKIGIGLSLGLLLAGMFYFKTIRIATVWLGVGVTLSNITWLVTSLAEASGKTKKEVKRALDDLETKASKI